MEEEFDKLQEFVVSLFETHDRILQQFRENYEANVKSLEEALFIDSNKGNNGLGGKTPQQTKKRSKRLTSVTEGEDDEVVPQDEMSTESSKSSRPLRAAKMNLDLKEKPINSKLRCPTNTTETILNVYIKKERTDKVHDNHAVKEKEIVTLNQRVETMEIDETDKTSPESSLVIVKKHNDLVEIDSEDEGEIMPPPTAPAPKKRGHKKNTLDELTGAPIHIKTEKLSINSSEGLSKKEETESELSDTVSSVEAKIKIPKKRGRPNKVTVPLPKTIKEEKLSVSPKLDTAALEPVEIPETPVKSNEFNRKESKSRQSHKSNRAGSFESVYEDAMAQPPETFENPNDKEPQSEALKTPEITMSTTKTPVNNVHVNELAKQKTPLMTASQTTASQNESNSEQVDTTFVSDKELLNRQNMSIQVADATFTKNSTIVNPGQLTFVMDKTIVHPLNATVTLKKLSEETVNAHSDATFNIKDTSTVNAGDTYIRASIMTEDNSNEESEDNGKDMEYLRKPVYKPKPKSKMNKKPVFNPFIQSPMKKKVEAFEKAAAIAASAEKPQRLTRTKSKQKQILQKSQQNNENETFENKTLVPFRETAKTTTPTIGRNLGRVLTPQQSSTNYTPTFLGAIPKKMPNSAKALSVYGSRTRDNSAEGSKRYEKFQQLAEERKKKQQQATLNREQKEKERKEHYQRVLEEREEKRRQLEQKRQMEEIQRNIKLQEEKNELKRKQEKQAALAAAAAKKEREMLDNLKIQKKKEELKMLQNQKLQATKSEERRWNFDILHTDDETDYEEEMDEKRPSLPEWSKRENRKPVLNNQAYMPTEIIDSFFSVQPITPDLRDIFPTINQSYCKRNSSMFWSTPPRYSELPKY